MGQSEDPASPISYGCVEIELWDVLAFLLLFSAFFIAFLNVKLYSEIGFQKCNKKCKKQQ